MDQSSKPSRFKPDRLAAGTDSELELGKCLFHVHKVLSSVQDRYVLSVFRSVVPLIAGFLLFLHSTGFCSYLYAENIDADIGARANFTLQVDQAARSAQTLRIPRCRSRQILLLCGNGTSLSSSRSEAKQSSIHPNALLCSSCVVRSVCQRAC